jgi:hypothetical protein
MATDNDSDSSFNPKRRLCPDGSCVGIIGPEGKCTVCGTSDAGGPPSEEESPHASDVLASEDEVEISPPEPDDTDGAFDPNRRLCSDASCIGVIGGNNRCRMCGKPAVS